MTELIKQSLDNPAELERLFRKSGNAFKAAFNSIFPEISESPIAKAWKERLNYESDLSWGTKNEISFVIAASLIAAFIAKVPQLAGINEELFFQRNLSFIFLPLLVVYYGIKESITTKNLAIILTVLAGCCIYINLLPSNSQSDTLWLACMHLPLFVWGILGITYCGKHSMLLSRRIDYLKHNGNLLVMMAVMVISAGIVTAMTFGLFELIKINISEFYSQYIIITGLAALPVIATHIVETNPQLVNKVSPVLAKIFTPVVLITLIIYLLAIAYTGRDPYNDREFLIIFNVVLAGVMALVLFSITGTGKLNRAMVLMLVTLSVTTIIVNAIALSAIVYRISEWGITPNRLAVTGSNVLMLVHLLLITKDLIKMLKSNSHQDDAANRIASYLPVYLLWSIMVIFMFPLLFGFR